MKQVTIVCDGSSLGNGKGNPRAAAVAGGGAQLTDKISSAYLLTLSRKPSAAELQAAEGYLNRQQDLYRTSKADPTQAQEKAFADFTQMLLSSNEFLYVD